MPSNTTTQKLRSLIILFLKIGLAVFFLWLLHLTGHLQFSFLKTLFKNPLLLVILLLISWSTYPLCALRWKWLLSVQGICIPFHQIFNMVYASAFIGLYLPGVVGADAVRIAFGSVAVTQKRTKMGFSVLVDRLLGVLGLSVIGLTACCMVLNRFWEDPDLRIFLFLLASIFLIIVTGLMTIATVSFIIAGSDLAQKWANGNLLVRFLSRIFRSTALYVRYPKTLASGLGISILVHAKNILLLTLLADYIGIGDLKLWEFAISGAVSFMVNFLPITPNGIGVGEVAFNQIASSLSNVSMPVAYATILLGFRVLTAISLVPAAFLISSCFKPISKATGRNHSSFERLK